MHVVRAATYVAAYQLVLTFEDGSVRLVDVAPHWEGEIFEPLHDRSYFTTVRVHPELDTLVWDNGADMSPEFLYEIGVPVETQAAVTESIALPVLRLVF